MNDLTIHDGFEPYYAGRPGFFSKETKSAKDKAGSLHKPRASAVRKAPSERGEAAPRRAVTPSSLF